MSDELLAAIFGRGDVRTVTDDRAWVAAMFRVEAALVRVQARFGLVSATDAEAICQVCDRVDDIDLAALAVASASGGNPLIPLVAQLRASVPEVAAETVHRFATSQDIIDTALMLMTRDSLDVVRRDLRTSVNAACGFTSHYRATPMMARTLGQAALPTTFGARTAGWLHGLLDTDDTIARLRRTLAVGVGGPVGTMAGYAEDAEAVVQALSAELGLADNGVWHTRRTVMADLAGGLAAAAGTVDKIATDVILLAQTEVGEVREAGSDRGGSSSMAHKRNPIAAIAAAAAARQAPGYATTLLTNQAHEHERAAGSWHAEWPALTGLLRSVGAAHVWLGDCLGRIEVNTEAMRRNVDGRDPADPVALDGLVANALRRADANQAHSKEADIDATR